MTVPSVRATTKKVLEPLKGNRPEAPLTLNTPEVPLMKNPLIMTKGESTALFSCCQSICSATDPAVVPVGGVGGLAVTIPPHVIVPSDSVAPTLSPIGILAKAYLPSLAIAALLLRRRRKKYCMVVLKQPKWYSPC